MRTLGAVGSRSDRSSRRRWLRFSAPSADDVAERQSHRAKLQVQLDYAFDRLRANKLAHAYEILVPARARPLEAAVRERVHADGGNLRPGLRGAAARGAHDCEPVRGPDRAGEAARALATEGLGRGFLKVPGGGTPEDEVLVEFQGVIAEYERAQILGRSRRGKRHRAGAGEISVLSGGPYGYRYIRKSEEAPASYAVIEAEARVVRQVYESYTVAGWSIGAITRWLNDDGVATRTPGAPRKPPIVCARLPNPPYPSTPSFR